MGNPAGARTGVCGILTAVAGGWIVRASKLRGSPRSGHGEDLGHRLPVLPGSPFLVETRLTVCALPPGLSPARAAPFCRSLKDYQRGFDDGLPTQEPTRGWNGDRGESGSVDANQRGAARDGGPRARSAGQPIAYSPLRNHPNAADAAPETRVRVLGSPKRLAKVDDLRAWLARIAQPRRWAGGFRTEKAPGPARTAPRSLIGRQVVPPP